MSNGIPREQIELLRTVPLFDSYTDRELAAIDGLLDEIDVRPGDALTRQGAAGGREAFVIVSGEAEVVIDGRRVSTLGPGEFFGEMALLDGRPRSATVTATTPMRLLLVGPAAFAGFLAQKGLAVRLLREVTARLRRADVRVSERTPA